MKTKIINNKGIRNNRSRIFPTKLMKKFIPKIGINTIMINA